MGFLDKIFGKADSTHKTHDSIFADKYQPDFDSLHDFGQIQSIFEWIFNPDIEIATKSAKAINRLLTRQTTFKNKALYHSLRHIYLKKTDLQKFDRFEKDFKLSLLSVASMNSSGYVREEALNGLLQNSNQFTFAFILFRLGDWVPVIKSKAMNAIKDVIRKEDPDFLISNHRLIDWLLKVERSDLRPIHSDIIQFIFSDSNIERMKQSIGRYSDGDRFFIFRNLIQKEKLKGLILEEILADKNHLIRLLAIRNIEFISNSDLTKKLLKDRSQKIRQYTINKIAHHQVNEFKTEIHRLLFDASSGIRAEARLLLERTSVYDFWSVYQEELQRKSDVGCILGLAEVGTKNDIQAIEKFLVSSSAKLRAASLFAISLLDYPYAKKLALQLLNDDSNAVKRTCCMIIPKEIFPTDLDVLRVIYDKGENDTKRFTLTIISRYGGWSIAGDFLKGILQTNEKVKETSYSLLTAWYKYSANLGTKQQANDKQFVMDIYNKGHINQVTLPPNIDRIVKEIPFIFSVDKK
jgi:hypothetical protein